MYFFTFFKKKILQLCFKYASEQIMVKIQCSKYQKLFKTLIRNIFQDMYCRAHKTATLTPIQHTGPPRFSDLPTALFTFTIVDLGHYFWLPLFGAGHQMACKPMTMGSNYLRSQNQFIIFEIVFSHKIANIFGNFWNTRIQIWLQIWLQKDLVPNYVCLCKLFYSFFFHFVLCSVQWMYCRM